MLFPKRTFLTVGLVICLLYQVFGQYEPPAGLPGSLAIHKDNAAIIGWCSYHSMNRGWVDIRDTSLGKTTVGDSSDVNGSVDNAVISLGDGGHVVLSFPFLLSDHPGYDFAVFENSFSDNFLELAFVEVSSDGVHFFRFPSHSLTPTSSQTGSFDLLDARNINNLAGKYREGFGTPFDLSELPDTSLLDKDSVRFVRVIDVVGSIDPAIASYDSKGNAINDPFPTPFPSGGFDLDAICVIESGWNSVAPPLNTSFKVYPNPAYSWQSVMLSGVENINKDAIRVYSLSGGSIPFSLDGDRLMLPSNLTGGTYFLTIENDGKTKTVKLSVR